MWTVVPVAFDFLPPCRQQMVKPYTQIEIVSFNGFHVSHDATARIHFQQLHAQNITAVSATFQYTQFWN